MSEKTHRPKKKRRQPAAPAPEAIEGEERDELTTAELEQAREDLSRGLGHISGAGEVER